MPKVGDVHEFVDGKGLIRSINPSGTRMAVMLFDGRTVDVPTGDAPADVPFAGSTEPADEPADGAASTGPSPASPAPPPKPAPKPAPKPPLDPAPAPKPETK